jgi:protein-S-isoprenylcysteine O-methyltransferase Ste14
MHKGIAPFLRETILSLLIPLIYLAFLIIVLRTGHWPDVQNLTWRELFASVSLLGGLLLWGISYWYIQPTVYLYPQANKLVTSGPYRYLRHPIYVGAMLVFFSLVYLSHSEWAFWYTLVIILPLNVGRALFEEKILSEILGKQYLLYRKKTFF